MSDILKEINGWKASFVTYMTPAEADGYDMVKKCEAEIERLREALRLAKDDMLRAVDHIDGELKND